MTVRIIEVIGRSVQGITRPFICRGDDGLQYFVKGNGAGRRALIAEWMAGQVGVRLGLPIPTFKQTLIPSQLVELSARDDVRDLGAGIGFGSQLVENVRLTLAGLQKLLSRFRDDPATFWEPS